jgi:hypothetical protein
MSNFPIRRKTNRALPTINLAKLYSCILRFRCARCAAA